MTTIVFDGIILAADSQRNRTHDSDSFEGQHCRECSAPVKRTAGFVEKLFVPKKKTMFLGERIIALASYGSVAITSGLKDAILTGIDPEEASRIYASFSASGRVFRSGGVLILTKNHLWQAYLGQEGYELTGITKFPHVVGSGSPYARTALEFVSPCAIEAVAVASHFDRATGGDIRSITRKKGAEVKITKVTQGMLDELKLRG